MSQIRLPFSFLLGTGVLLSTGLRVPNAFSESAGRIYGLDQVSLSIVSIHSVLSVQGRVTSRVGSGFVLEKGLVATNWNVVENADSIFITLTDGRTSRTCTLHDDASTGLTLLRMPFEDAPPLEPSDSEELKPSAPLTILGNSLGIFPSVTLGTFSRRTAKGLLEINCVIPPGNSGGPVLDESGKLVGMVIGRAHRGQGPEKREDMTGLAVPVEAIVKAVKTFRKNADEGAGWVGLSVVDLDHSYTEKGVRVVRLMPGGPAEQAGISRGDTIVRIDGQPVKNACDMAAKVRKTEPNSPVSFSIQKGKTLLQRQVKVGSCP
jgi:S1-C subfamily serine protease